MRYLDPKNDLTFKKVFGEHPHLLRSFLNAMLPLPPDRQVVSLEYLSPEMVPQIPVMKNSIVDVRCLDASGRQFIVEMQVLWTDSFYKRVVFNASKAYVKQLKTSEHYHLLQPVYSLNLIDDTFLAESKEYYHHYQIVNAADTGHRIEGLEFVFIELPKFEPKTIVEKKLRALWLRFLTEIQDNSTEVPTEILQDADIREAVECLQESAFSPAELETYDRYWDHVRVERTLIADSHAEGEEAGIVKGEKIGIEKGRKEGREEGLQEALTRIVASGIAESEAKKMLGLS